MSQEMRIHCESEYITQGGTGEHEDSNTHTDSHEHVYVETSGQFAS